MSKTKGKTSTRQQRLVPTPLLNPDTPVKWWFLFKLNSAEEPGEEKPKGIKGIFDVKGWTQPPYDDDKGDSKKFSQHYLFASSRNSTLQLGRGILGATKYDPLGATFGQVYNGSYHYVIWNDQFYDDPRASAGSPWGHSKGMVAWNDDGKGFVMQVSTPSWPASGSRKYPRQTDGNTLGYVRDDDIEVSQHFFALSLNRADLLKVLAAMHNAGVVTKVSSTATWNDRPAKFKRHVAALKKKGKKPPSPPNPPLPKPLPRPPHKEQVISTEGSPKDIQDLVDALGTKPKDRKDLVDALGKKPNDGKCLKVKLSSGVTLITKPAYLAVPPWQMVSAKLGGVDLRVASWWAYPKIYTTTKASPKPAYWDDTLRKPGAVEIAISGTLELIRKNKVYEPHTRKWKTILKDKQKVYSLGLLGEPNAHGNHAKIGVSTDRRHPYSIFGDMNQQGALSKGETGKSASSSQNGRGGLFYVMDDEKLFASLASLLTGDSAAESKEAEAAAKKAKASKKLKKAKKTK